MSEEALQRCEDDLRPERGSLSCYFCPHCWTGHFLGRAYGGHMCILRCPLFWPQLSIQLSVFQLGNQFSFIIVGNHSSLADNFETIVLCCRIDAYVYRAEQPVSLSSSLRRSHTFVEYVTTQWMSSPVSQCFETWGQVKRVRKAWRVVSMCWRQCSSVERNRVNLSSCKDVYTYPDDYFTLSFSI